MTATLFTAGAGSGKTAQLIQTLLELEQEAFWEERWVLLPTRLQSEAFRERLMAQAGYKALFNIRFFEFYELYDWLLDFAALPQRTITGAASDHILRQVINTLHQQGALFYYHKIAHTPGFVQLVSRFIKELKQGVVTLDAFEQVASTPKDQDLLHIYTDYQHFLEGNQLVDRDGAGWVALKALQANTELVKHVRLLAVDGFDNITPLQAQLLAALGGQVGELYFTLTYESHRQADASRPFQRTLERLHAYGTWEVETVGATLRPPLQQKSAPLRHLTEQLFSLHPQPIAHQESLLLIEAPSARDEVTGVLRHIKQLLLEGVTPDKIAVVIRDPERYMEAFRSIARLYQLPVVVRQAEELIQNPAIQAILSLIDSHQQGFPRRQWLDLLRSPYLRPPNLTPNDIGFLERLSQEIPIISGRDNWLAGLERGLKKDRNEDTKSEFIPAPEGLLEALSQLFHQLTPPQGGGSPYEFVGWLEALLGPDLELLDTSMDDSLLDTAQEGQVRQDFRFYEQVRHEVADSILVRDLHALHSFRMAVQEVLAAYELLKVTSLTWAEFRADLAIALAKRRISDPLVRSRLGRVLITTVFEARGLPHEYVFIVGLAEGVFPHAQGEDALYNDTERLALESAGLDVETAADRSRDGGLFYEMCALAQKRLILSRPTLDEGGNEWMASIFWRNVQELLPNPPLERLRLGAAPFLDGTIAARAVTWRELAIGVSAALSQSVAQLNPSTWSVVSALTARPLWSQVVGGYQLEARRESPDHALDRYTGILSDPALIAEVNRQLGPSKVWSASQFNELGECGFRFFSRRVLALEPYEEPEEGLTVLQLGTLNHEILEHTYRVFEQEQWVIGSDLQAEAVNVLHQIAPPLLARAPQHHRFKAPATWQQQQAGMLRKLEQVIRLDFSEESPLAALKYGERRILQLEKPFGFEGQPLLEIKGAEGPLRAGGFIDRIDIVDGRYALVLDYKSGTKTPTPDDLTVGRNYQMLLYLLAVAQWLKAQQIEVVGGLFWSLQTNKTSKPIYLYDAKDQVGIAKDLLHYQVGLARAGQFANQPNNYGALTCSAHCEFTRLCRANWASQRKSMPAL